MCFKKTRSCSNWQLLKVSTCIIGMDDVDHPECFAPRGREGFSMSDAAPGRLRRPADRAEGFLNQIQTCLCWPGISRQVLAGKEAGLQRCWQVTGVAPRRGASRAFRHDVSSCSSRGLKSAATTRHDSSLMNLIYSSTRTSWSQSLRISSYVWNKCLHFPQHRASRLHLLRAHSSWVFFLPVKAERGSALAASRFLCSFYFQEVWVILYCKRLLPALLRPRSHQHEQLKSSAAAGLELLSSCETRQNHQI